MVDRRQLLAFGAGLGAATFLAAPAHAVPATVDLDTLRRRLSARRAEFSAARYTDLAARLPALRMDVLAARRSLPDSRNQSVNALLARVEVLSSELAVKAGRDESAWFHARAAVAAAEDSGSPSVLAEAIRICATPLRRQGRAGEAVVLLKNTINRLNTESEPVNVAAVGELALTAAYSAALAGQETEALVLVETAADAVGRLQGASGPTAHQVALYEVGVNHLLGFDVTAVRIAQRIDPRLLPPGERRARLATDAARALLALGDHDRAFVSLLAVEDAAREEASRPSVRALTGTLLERRPRLAGLGAFAARTGVVPV